MIFTVTCNPAIDKTISNDKTSYTIGGKGINVSKALNVLGIKTIATGFLGKDNGELVINDLDNNDISSDFIYVDGKVRCNTKSIINNELFENNELGPFVEKQKQQDLLNKIVEIKNSTLIISGSVPSGVDKNYYKHIIEKAKSNNCYVILDTSKELLKEGIEAIPDVIKPNKDEICEYFNIQYDKNLVISKSKELIKKGIKLIVVSLGKNGSLFIFDDVVYEVPALEVKYVSSLCAGDSMVAGIAYGKEIGLSDLEMIKLAVSCASCSVEEVSTFTNKDKVFDYMNKVRIEVLK